MNILESVVRDNKRLIRVEVLIETYEVNKSFNIDKNSCVHFITL